MPTTSASTVPAESWAAVTAAVSTSIASCQATSPRCAAAGEQNAPMRSPETAHRAAGVAVAAETDTMLACVQGRFGPPRSLTTSQAASWFHALRQAFFQETAASTRSAAAPAGRQTRRVSTRRSLAWAEPARAASMKPARSRNGLGIRTSSTSLGERYEATSATGVQPPERGGGRIPREDDRRLVAVRERDLLRRGTLEQRGVHRVGHGGVRGRVEGLDLDARERPVEPPAHERGPRRVVRERGRHRQLVVAGPLLPPADRAARSEGQLDAEAVGGAAQGAEAHRVGRAVAGEVQRALAGVPDGRVGGCARRRS